jgi:hypothetical protein
VVCEDLPCIKQAGCTHNHDNNWRKLATKWPADCPFPGQGSEHACQTILAYTARIALQQIMHTHTHTKKYPVLNQVLYWTIYSCWDTKPWYNGALWS